MMIAPPRNLAGASAGIETGLVLRELAIYRFPARLWDCRALIGVNWADRARPQEQYVTDSPPTFDLHQRCSAGSAVNGWVFSAAERIER
jgi:hypothetical protein